MNYDKQQMNAVWFCLLAFVAGWIMSGFVL